MPSVYVSNRTREPADKPCQLPTAGGFTSLPRVSHDGHIEAASAATIPIKTAGAQCAATEVLRRV